MIDSRRKFIFIHIPRTSGTSIECSLGFRVAALKHITAQMTFDKVGQDAWDESFKFTIVRNPWDRAISLWKQPAFAKIHRDSSLEKFLTDYKPFGHEYGVTFADYLDHGELDLTLRFEKRVEGLKKLSEKLGVRVDPTVHKKNTDRLPYQKYFNKTTIQMVWDKWGEDATKYNYNYES